MEPNSANVIAGFGKIKIAPLGTALPDLTVGYPITWPAGWLDWGYTDDGVEFAYAPTVKDISVDEELAPVNKLLTAEKCTVVAKLAEATLSNMGYGISASSLVVTAPTDTVQGTKVLTFGSGTLKKFMLGFEGPAPDTSLKRVIIITEAISTGQVQTKYQRADKTIIPVTFEALADSSLPAGSRLCKIVDFDPTSATVANVAAVNPTGGVHGTTFPVLITGVNFGNSGVVTIGGTAATVLSYSDTQIVAMVPASLAAGAKLVAVTPTGGVVSTGAVNVTLT